MDNQRIYFVIDARSFYASVECAERGLDPLTTKLVVADKSRSEKTICLAVSPAVKAMGVKNRCRLYEVPKDPDIIIAPPRMKKYIKVAAEIYGVYLRHIAKEDMHVYSIDEVILDVTSYLKLYSTTPLELAKLLMKEANEATGVPFTCGIGTNMYLAKVASGILAKNSPDGIAYLDEKGFIEKLSNHRPLSDFWQISRGISARLSKYGVFDMAGIRDIEEDILYREFGVDAELLIDHANGIEPTLMEDIKGYKSKGHSFGTNQILSRPYGKMESLEVLLGMIESLSLALAKQGKVSSRLFVAATYEEDKRKWRPSIHFNCDIVGKSNLAKDFIPLVKEQLHRLSDPKRFIRSIAIAFIDVVEEPVASFDLFADDSKQKKEVALRDSLLAIEDRYGKNAVLRANDFTSSSTRKERNTFIGGHAGGEEDE